MVVQRMQSSGSQDARLTQATAQYFAPAQRLRDQFIATAQGRTDGRAQTLAETHGNAVKVVHDPAHAVAHRASLGLCHAGVKQTGAIQVRGQAMLSGQPCRLREIGLRHGVTIPGVFKSQQTGACKVTVHRFDGGSDVGQRHFARSVLCQRLRLNAAQHSGAPAFVAVGVRVLSNDVFVSAFAMCHQGAQIALRSGGHEQRRLFACDLGNPFLQGIDRGVITKHIIAQWGFQHGFTHRRCGLRDRIASQVNDHGRDRKLLSMACPCSVRMDSG